MKDHPHLSTAFHDLGLQIDLLKGLHKLGFETPTDIQREMIPPILSGRDVLGQARTGTGKTAAFGLPILQRLDDTKRLQAVVLVPTRELAVQVAAEIRRLAEFKPLRVVPVYGGQAIRAQVKVLGRRTHFVVATPGRILDLINRRILDLQEVEYVVLDEVDRMLDIGFIDDIRNFLGGVPKPHQTVFVSATLNSEIRTLSMQFMTDPVEIDVSRDEITVESIEQSFCTVDPWDKFRLLRMVLAQEQPTLAIVFTNTKHQARKLAKKLHEAGVNVKEIHGDLVQRKRERVMDRFRRHKIQVLVATDLAARGIDVNNISHIINYDLPQDSQIYVHRIGRTARMGAFGRAITFVTREQGHELTKIEVLVNKQIEEMVFHDFKPRPPREEVGPAEAPPLSRLAAPLFGDTTPETTTQVASKGLGGKFKTRRRRR